MSYPSAKLFYGFKLEPNYIKDTNTVEAKYDDRVIFVKDIDDHSLFYENNIFYEDEKIWLGKILLEMETFNQPCYNEIQELNHPAVDNLAEILHLEPKLYMLLWFYD